MWIVAGPNGAGKSTFTQSRVLHHISDVNLRQLNADERAQQIRAVAPETQNIALQAAIAIDTAVVECIERREDFLVETVLSTEKYLDDVRRARELGFRIGLVYVALATPEDAVRRVALRVAQGGHDVPFDRIVARWSRSLTMLGHFLSFADCFYIFDNSDPGIERHPALIAYKDLLQDLVLLERGRIPIIDEVLRQFENFGESR
jgi:predicted ABC-type ATPase